MFKNWGLTHKNGAPYSRITENRYILTRYLSQMFRERIGTVRSVGTMVECIRVQQVRLYCAGWMDSRIHGPGQIRVEKKSSEWNNPRIVDRGGDKHRIEQSWAETENKKWAGWSSIYDHTLMLTQPYTVLDRIGLALMPQVIYPDIRIWITFYTRG